MRLFTICSLASLAPILTTAALAQQPAVTGLQNNYSFLQPGLPNYGIAQGSVFDIFGNNLATGPATALLSVPLRTTVNGVSANVTVNGATVPVLLYYVSSTQIAAILPSRTPVGTGQITVTRSGQTSAPVAIQVVPSAFGILTLNGSGNGSAAAFDVSANYLGFTNSANPGEFITLWGSGLGPAPGDETIQQTPQDLANVPIEVDIGGFPAMVAYHGRSIYPGLDQINVVVPQGVQGCFVSVVVRNGNIVSNFATLPVASSGRICGDLTTGFTPAVIQGLASKASFTEGIFNILNAPLESASAKFSRVISTQFSANRFADLGASTGSCLVYQAMAGVTSVAGPNPSTGLDAGTAINVKGPNGTQMLPRQPFGFYTAILSGGATGIPVFVPATGGTFSFDNGAGGADVGAFTGQVTVTSPFVFSNRSSLTVINRSEGATVTWTGGDPNSYVSITGQSYASGSSTGAYFNCTAPVAAGQFTIPQTVLLSLPASAPAGDPNAFPSEISVSNITYPQSFTAPGLDVAFATVTRETSTSVRYQ